MATENQTTQQRQRSAAGKRAAATRKRAAARRSASANRAAATREINQRTPVQQVQAVAERAVLVPVGAALTATDRVTDTVSGLAKSYGTRARAQKRIERDVKRFERRGARARTSVERELKRTRTRVERELRQRRRQSTVVTSRVDEAVATGQKAVAGAGERVASAV